MGLGARGVAMTPSAWPSTLFVEENGASFAGASPLSSPLLREGFGNQAQLFKAAVLSL